MKKIKPREISREKKKKKISQRKNIFDIKIIHR